MSIITLLTDFGTQDIYAGVMKGVILSICPEARIVDITHDIPPQDIRTAAWQLCNSYRYFPEHTIHVAVVDPEVGTSRRPLLIRGGGYCFVGPDNGVFSLVCRSLKEYAAYSLNRKEFFLNEVTQTFHGRDIFAPVAAHVACGRLPEELGDPVTDNVILPMAQVLSDDLVLRGEVIYIDHFGNLITNISREEFSAFVRNQPFLIRIADAAIRSVYRTYAEAKPHDIVALFGSNDYLEIAENSGNAASALGVDKGTRVIIVRDLGT
ncbi:MAG: SAM-dependent chlorinase/fluorinase [Pseudomonadota bacterium]